MEYSATTVAIPLPDAVLSTQVSSPGFSILCICSEICAVVVVGGGTPEVRSEMSAVVEHLDSSDCIFAHEPGVAVEFNVEVIALDNHKKS